MKKISVMLFCVLLLAALLSACGGLKTDSADEAAIDTDCGITLTVTDGASAGAEYTVLNTLDAEVSCGTGADAQLEVLKNGKWYTLKANGGSYAVTDELWYCPQGTETEFTFYWNDYYGLLPAGEYRIVKTVCCEGSDGSFANYRIAGNFTVGK